MLVSMQFSFLGDSGVRKPVWTLSLVSPRTSRGFGEEFREFFGGGMGGGGGGRGGPGGPRQAGGGGGGQLGGLVVGGGVGRGRVSGFVVWSHGTSPWGYAHSDLRPATGTLSGSE